MAIMKGFENNNCDIGTKVKVYETFLLSLSVGW